MQRSANRIRATAQLIDARTDAHVWAEHYDRDLTDTFAIQARNRGGDRARAARPAFAHRESGDRAADAEPGGVRSLPAGEATHQQFPRDSRIGRQRCCMRCACSIEAIAHDGNFALAYCWATTANDNLYWFGLDRSPERLDQAKASAQTALALAPDLGEAHLAQALVFYHGERDYARALEQVAHAKRTLPNSAETYSLAGWIARRQGEWGRARENLEKAAGARSGKSQGYQRPLRALRSPARLRCEAGALRSRARGEPRFARLFPAAPRGDGDRERQP